MQKIKERCLVWLLLPCLVLAGCSNVTENEEISSETSMVTTTSTVPETTEDEPATEEVTEAATEMTTEETKEVTEAATEMTTEETKEVTTEEVSYETTISLDDIPEYSGSAYVTINDNEPFFTEEDLTTTSYEYYSDLDSLGRCGVAYACVGTDLMPTEERESISEVKPTGWQSVKYDNVDGESLYNRCHLIAYQLTGENANEKNLITGTRYMNVEGMQPFENIVANYVEETDNHVLYRVTPIFDGDNLLVSGVLMEALSVEDEGDNVAFNVYCYNVQPGISIDYETGDSWEDDAETTEEETSSSGTTYILNTNTMRFHYPSCFSVDQMSDANKEEYTGDREDLIDQGYSPCGNCNP